MNRQIDHSNWLPPTAAGVVALLMISQCTVAHANSVSGAGTGDEARDRSASALYEHGSSKLGALQFSDAERALRGALEKNEVAVMPPALYNLGHARFAMGKELLKGAMPSEEVTGTGSGAKEAAQTALTEIGKALQSKQIQEALSAYGQGRVSRKQLRSAMDMVRRAIDLATAVEGKWGRSLADFKSSNELQPSDDAMHNAGSVKRQLEALQQDKKELQALLQQLAQMRAALGAAMRELGKQLPEGMQNPGGDEEEDEEDGSHEGDRRPEDAGGKQEQRIGRGPLEISPEMAEMILNNMKGQDRRKLAQPDGEAGKPQNPTGKTW